MYNIFIIMAHSFLPRVLFALHGSVPPVGSNICAIIDIGHRAFCSVSSKSHSRQCHNLPADELRVQLGSSSIIKLIDAPLPLPGVLFQTHPLPGVCIEEELESEPPCSNRVFPEKKNLDGREGIMHLYQRNQNHTSPNRGNVHLPSV